MNRLIVLQAMLMVFCVSAIPQAHAATVSIAQDVAGQYVFCDLCPAPTTKVLDLPEPVLPTPSTAQQQPSIVGASAPEKVFGIRVQFGLNSAVITPKAATVLAEVAKTLGTVSTITIVGHTDKTGKETRNKPLALARAKAVKAFLVKRGIKPAIVRLESLCCIDSPPAWNPAARRVEIKAVQ